MKTVIINGQNHKGSTYHIGRIFAEKVADENEITEFFLPRDLNHFCLGCYTCVEDETKCPFWEEKKVIMDALSQADLFIFTSPNYCLAPSGAMKSFIDLTFDYWMVHRPKEWMFHKKAVVFSTSAGSSNRSALKVVKNALFYWGVPYIKSYGTALQAMNWEHVSEKNKDRVENDMERLAQKIKKSKEPKVGIKTRIIFNLMGKMHAAGWDSSPVEKEYWEVKGWLGKKRPWNSK